MTVERYYEDAKVGDECITPSVTVTAEMINAYADLSGDHTPIHVDEEYARKSDFGTRVAHGLLGRGVRELCIDLHELSFVDSSMLNVLVNVRASLRSRGGNLRIQPNMTISMLLEVAGLGELFDLIDGDRDA